MTKSAYELIRDVQDELNTISAVCTAMNLNDAREEVFSDIIVNALADARYALTRLNAKLSEIQGKLDDPF